MAGGVPGAHGGGSVLFQSLIVQVFSVGSPQPVIITVKLNLQHTEIKRSFGQSTIQVETRFRGPLYTDLLGSISVAALEDIQKEEELAKAGCQDVVECLHKVRFTMGLPCAHELMTYINQSRPFPLWMVHKHWKQLKLHVTPLKVDDDTVYDIQIELDGLVHMYTNSYDIKKKELKRELRELLDPTTSQTLEPIMPKKLKGRPKGSTKKYKDDYKSTKRDLSLFEHVILNEQTQGSNMSKLKIPKKVSRLTTFLRSIRKEMPPSISNHITDAINVIGDGHCGYRVVCLSLNMGENWLQVRRDLSLELQHNSNLYTNMYGNVRLQELLVSLDCNVVPTPFDKWMSIPDMGLVIASCYNVAFVHFSKYQSFTFLPLHSAPPEVGKVIFIGFVNENHFIQLVMDEECPLPPIFSMWQRYHSPISESWEIQYISRFRDMHSDETPSAIINLADP